MIQAFSTYLRGLCLITIMHTQSAASQTNAKCMECNVNLRTVSTYRSNYSTDRSVQNGTRDWILVASGNEIFFYNPVTKALEHDNGYIADIALVCWNSATTRQPSR